MKFVACAAAAAMVGLFACGSASAATLVFQVTIDTKDVYQFEIKNELVKTNKTTTTHPSQTFNVTVQAEDLFGIDNSSYSDATSAAWRNEAHPGVLSVSALPTTMANELLTVAGTGLGDAQMSSYFKASDEYYEKPYGLGTVVSRTDEAGVDWGRYRDAYAETAHTVSNNYGGYYFSMSYAKQTPPPAYDPRTFTSAQLLELFEGVTFNFAAVGYSGSYLYTDGYTNSEISKSTTYSGVAKLVSVDVPVTAPAPEPATWALMIGGFAMAGGALRRRRVAA